MSKNIYVVHEYGAPSHYYGLDSWATANGYNIYYRELWRLKNVVKHPKRWVKFLINICFLCLISYKPKCKIVLCVAPFNNRLPNLMKKMQKHEVYYHTSYTCWDGTFMQYEPKNQYIVDSWKYFTSPTPGEENNTAYFDTLGGTDGNT